MSNQHQSSPVENHQISNYNPRHIMMAKLVIASQILFTLGWIVAGLLQGNGYSISDHDISDLGALTASRPLLLLIPMGIAGLVTILFALGTLFPIFKKSGIKIPVGALFIALSLMGLDNFSDFFFRLDCRAADAGCTPELAAASMQGKIHLIVALVSVLFTVAAPFAMWSHMRKLDAWKSIASKTILFAALLIAALIGYILTEGAYGHGFIQRIMCLMLSFGMIVLALKVLKIVKPI